MEKLRALWGDLQAKFSALSARERTLVSIAGAAVVVFALFLILYTSASNASATRRRTADKLAKLQTAQQLAQSYREAELVRRRTEQQLSGNNLQLISYLEERGTRAGLDIPAMNPKGDVSLGDGKIIESSVELTLTDVPLAQFYNFLSEVERGPGLIKVKYLRIEPRPGTETLTAWVNIAAYKMRQ